MEPGLSRREFLATAAAGTAIDLGLLLDSATKLGSLSQLPQGRQCLAGLLNPAQLIRQPLGFHQVSPAMEQGVKFDRRESQSAVPWPNGTT